MARGVWRERAGDALLAPAAYEVAYSADRPPVCVPNPRK